jgi:hypothetical protein
MTGTNVPTVWSGPAFAVSVAAAFEAKKRKAMWQTARPQAPKDGRIKIMSVMEKSSFQASTLLAFGFAKTADLICHRTQITFFHHFNVFSVCDYLPVTYAYSFLQLCLQ